MSESAQAIEHSFRLIIPGEKEVTYDITNFSVPGLTLAKTPTQFQDKELSIPDNLLTVDDLSFSILLTDAFNGYIRLVKWMQDARTTEAGYRKKVRIQVWDPSFSNLIAELVYSGAWPTNIGTFEGNFGTIQPNAMLLPVTLSVDGILDIE